MEAALSQEERNLLSVAYKNAIGGRRAALRILHSIEAHDRARTSVRERDTLRLYSLKINSELQSICGDLLAVVEKHLLLKTETDKDAAIFFHKLYAEKSQYLPTGLSSRYVSGVGTITATLRNASSMTPTNTSVSQKLHSTITLQPLTSHLSIWRQRTLCVSDSHSTSACFGSKSWAHRSRHVTLPRSPSTTRSKNWTHCQRTAIARLR